MKTKKPASRTLDFQRGQVWRMGEDRVQIQLVGKWLVHYRQYKGPTKRLPTCFTAKSDLEKLLSVHKAVLVQEEIPTGKVLRARPARRAHNLRSSGLASARRRSPRAAGRRCSRG